MATRSRAMSLNSSTIVKQLCEDYPTFNDENIEPNTTLYNNFEEVIIDFLIRLR
jgi:hypothetical protein